MYGYGASAFPTQTFNSSNYWVDVVFAASGGADTTAPTVAMTAPANGATVSGSAVTVSATAADNVGVVGVQFKLDGANLGAEDTAPPLYADVEYDDDRQRQSHADRGGARRGRQHHDVDGGHRHRQ